MKRQVAFVVRFELPDGAGLNDAKQYVEDAVHSWAGSLRPPGSYNESDEGDPMFGLNRASVGVETLRIRRTK